VSDSDSAAAPRRRRTPRAQRKSTNTAEGSPARPSDEEGAGGDPATPAVAAPDAAAEAEQSAAEQENAGATADGEEESGTAASADKGHRASLVGLARRAAEYVRVLTGRHPESVISIERRDGDWCLGVEVIETRRIPDSADILAVYEVLLTSAGNLVSYRRIRRYTRGQVDRHGR
jgi:hypothetical protein